MSDAQSTLITGIGELVSNDGQPDAFAAMTKDEQFLKEAEKIGLEVGLIRSEDLNRDIESTLRDKRLMDLYRTIASVK